MSGLLPAAPPRVASEVHASRDDGKRRWLATTAMASRPLPRSVPALLILGATCFLVLLAAGVSVIGWPNWDSGFLATEAMIVLLPVFLLAHSFLLCRRSLQRGQGWAGLGGLAIAAVTLVAISLPSLELALGITSSKLDTLGFGAFDMRAEIGAADRLFVVALVAFAVGQLLYSRLRRVPLQVSKPAGWRSSLRAAVETPSTYFGLMLCGIVGHLLLIGSPAADIANRSLVRGAGIPLTLGYGIWLAASIGVLQRHWGSRLLPLVTTAAVVFAESLTVTRTPLVLLGIAFGLRFLRASSVSPRPWAQIAGAVLLVYVGATLVVAISGWRADLTRPGRTGTLFSEVLSAAQNPFANLSGASSSTQASGGLDSVEGLILARHVDPAAVGASYADPLKAVSELVPSQLWPDKPAFLGNTITYRYTNIGAGAGLFLSGPGYSYIVYSGVPGVAGVFLILGILSGVVFKSSRRTPIIVCLFAYFIVEFTAEGDAFNAFQLITFLGLLFFGTALGQGAFHTLSGHPTTTRVPRL